MNIALQRFASLPDSTLGALSIDGRFACFTLEDERRDIKVPGETRLTAFSRHEGKWVFSAFERCPQRVVIDATACSDFFNRQLAYSQGIAPIERLSFRSRPSAISWFVISIVVDAIERGSRWFWSHIRIESRKTAQPTLAHSDAAFPVVLELRRLLVVATLLGSVPRAVLARSGEIVRRAWVWLATSMTAAAMFFSHILVVSSDCVSTIASSDPFSTAKRSFESQSTESAPCFNCLPRSTAAASCMTGAQPLSFDRGLFSTIAPTMPRAMRD